MTLLDWVGSGRARALGPAGRALSAVLCMGLAVTFIAVAGGVYIDETIGLYLFLGGVLSLAFLHTTGNVRRPTHETLSAWLLTLTSLACCAYFVVMHDVHKDRLPVLDPLSTADVAVSIMLIALVLEATRRTIGIVLVLLVGLFLGYAALGDRLTGAFSHRGMSVPEMIDQLVFTNNGDRKSVV